MDRIGSRKGWTPIESAIFTHSVLKSCRSPMQEQDTCQLSVVSGSDEASPRESVRGRSQKTVARISNRGCRLRNIG